MVSFREMREGSTVEHNFGVVWDSLLFLLVFQRRPRLAHLRARMIQRSNAKANKTLALSFSRQNGKFQECK